MLLKLFPHEDIEKVSLRVVSAETIMALSIRNAPIPDRGPKVEVVSLIMASLSILAVSARLFRRLGMSESSFGWDDAAISLALVCVKHVIMPFNTIQAPFIDCIYRLSQLDERVPMLLVRSTYWQLSGLFSLTRSEAVQNFGFGKHEADLPPSIAHSHKADLVSHPQ